MYNILFQILWNDYSYVCLNSYRVIELFDDIKYVFYQTHVIWWKEQEYELDDLW